MTREEQSASSRIFLALPLLGAQPPVPPRCVCAFLHALFLSAQIRQ
jgi:hypothetical protein